MARSGKDNRKLKHRSYDKAEQPKNNNATQRGLLSKKEVFWEEAKKTAAAKKKLGNFPSKVLIFTKEWTKVKTGACQKCGSKDTNYLWLCYDTSAGAIKLCSTCFREAYDRSFEPKDPLDYAWSGGDFSGNS